jgi:hypothetical protein
MGVFSGMAVMAVLVVYRQKTLKLEFFIRLGVPAASFRCPPHAQAYWRIVDQSRNRTAAALAQS